MKCKTLMRLLVVIYVDKQELKLAIGSKVFAGLYAGICAYAHAYVWIHMHIHTYVTHSRPPLSPMDECMPLLITRTPVPQSLPLRSAFIVMH